VLQMRDSDDETAPAIKCHTGWMVSYQVRHPLSTSPGSPQPSPAGKHWRSARLSGFRRLMKLIR